MPGRLLARHVLPGALAMLFALPLWFMVAGSLRPSGVAPPQGFQLLPASPTLEAYARLPRLVPLWVYLRNSLLVVAVAVPLTVLVASWAGFGIRLLHGRARRAAVGVSLVALMVPVTAVWATRFEVFRLLGAVDTLAPLVAPAAFGTTPFYALLYAWSFSGIRQTQIEAARLEGASAWRIWRRIALPQARHVTLAVAVLAFTFHWGNFIDPLLYLQSQDRFTLPLGLRFLQLLNPTDWPVLLAGAVVVTLPPVVVFLAAQRWLLGRWVLGVRR
jgi:multiple sugar transport system permease protein